MTGGPESGFKHRLDDSVTSALRPTVIAEPSTRSSAATTASASQACKPFGSADQRTVFQRSEFASSGIFNPVYGGEVISGQSRSVCWLGRKTLHSLGK
jgi:hypothetical protein